MTREIARKLRQYMQACCKRRKYLTYRENKIKIDNKTEIPTNKIPILRLRKKVITWTKDYTAD